MPIEATTPTVVSATYPFWAFQFQTNGLGLAAPGQSDPDTVSCTARLVKYRVREDGVCEQSPLASDVVTVAVPDLYALMATDADVAGAFTALVGAVQKIAAARGLL